MLIKYRGCDGRRLPAKNTGAGNRDQEIATGHRAISRQAEGSENKDQGCRGKHSGREQQRTCGESGCQPDAKARILVAGAIGMVAIR
jgi:hypothetical protein